MKAKYTLTLFLALSFFVSNAQWINIPDSNWGKWLIQTYPTCMQGNALVGFQLDTTCTSIINETYVDCSYKQIYDLTGIEFFRNITTLRCRGNNISFLPKLSNTLAELNCEVNKLTSFANLPNNLKTLNCWGNQLTSPLQNLPNTLVNINCGLNKLTYLPNPMPDSLRHLNCEFNQLTSLPHLPNELITLNCNNNSITDLSIPNSLHLPDSLRYLDCSSNQLVSLPTLPELLIELNCSRNQLVDFLPYYNSIYFFRHLVKFNCSYNQITAISNISYVIEEVDCSHNPITTGGTQYFLPASSINVAYTQLSSLDVYGGLSKVDCSGNPNMNINSISNSGIVHFTCQNSQLNSLPPLHSYMTYLDCSNNNLTCLPKLPQLYEFYIANNPISCIPNRINPTYFDINPANLPLCDISSGCPFYYDIAGNVHQMVSQTCLNDIYNPGNGLHNVKVLLKDTNQNVVQQFYTDDMGNYTFDADSIAFYTIEIDTNDLPFAINCPDSNFHVASLYPNAAPTNNLNFALSCKGVDFSTRSICAWRFRPTFPTTVYCKSGDMLKQMYSASCGNPSTGKVTTLFSGAVHFESAAPNALTPIVNGNQLTYFISNLDSLKSDDLNFILNTDTFAPIGSQVCITTIITSDSNDINHQNDTLTQCFPVVNSYDPNEKQVYPNRLSINGDWLTYTIHFQNTGNDTAYIVLIRDTLPQQVIPESFQYLTSSHKCIIQIKGKEVVFAFQKINLVDSATNEPLSTGWVQFKVRTTNNLPLQLSINNRAAIFFDYNPAIYTEFAKAIVAPPCISTFSLLSDSICDGHTYVFNGKNLTQQGIYKDTLTNIEGCDSIVTLHLGIKTPPTTPQIERTGNTLNTASISNCQYQWFINSQPIAGASDTALTFSLNGSYTVQILAPNNCSATSLDYSILNVGITEQFNMQISLFPNPNNGSFHIVVPESFVGAELTITDVLGREDFIDSVRNSNQTIVLNNFTSGIYFAKLTKGQNCITIKLAIHSNN